MKNRKIVVVTEGRNSQSFEVTKDYGETMYCLGHDGKEYLVSLRGKTAFVMRREDGRQTLKGSWRTWEYQYGN